MAKNLNKTFDSNKIFTPQDVAIDTIRLVEKAGAKFTAKSRIIDPACGYGMFLRTLVPWLHNKGFSYNEIIDMLYGIDNDETVLLKARNKFADLIKKYDEEAYNSNQTKFSKHFLCTDSLEIDYYKLLPEIFNLNFPKSWGSVDEGFDLVIMNPPWSKAEGYTVPMYPDSPEGKPENYPGTKTGIFAPFVRRGSDIVHYNKWFAAVVPATFLTSLDYREARDILFQMIRLDFVAVYNCNVFTNHDTGNPIPQKTAIIVGTRINRRPDAESKIPLQEGPDKKEHFFTYIEIDTLDHKDGVTWKERFSNQKKGSFILGKPIVPQDRLTVESEDYGGTIKDVTDNVRGTLYLRKKEDEALVDEKSVLFFIYNKKDDYQFFNNFKEAGAYLNYEGRHRSTVNHIHFKTIGWKKWFLLLHKYGFYKDFLNNKASDRYTGKDITVSLMKSLPIPYHPKPEDKVNPDNLMEWLKSCVDRSKENFKKLNAAIKDDKSKIDGFCHIPGCKNPIKFTKYEQDSRNPNASYCKSCQDELKRLQNDPVARNKFLGGDKPVDPWSLDI